MFILVFFHVCAILVAEMITCESRNSLNISVKFWFHRGIIWLIENANLAKSNLFCKLSQTCVHRPPSRPENSGLGMIWKNLFLGGIQVVVVQRRSLTQVWLSSRNLKPKMTFWSRKSPKYYEVLTKIKKCRSIIPVIVIGIFVVRVRFIRKFVEKIASAHSWHFAGSVWK